MIALVFAGFLIGLGSLIVGDLPHVDSAISREQFIDHGAVDPLRLSARAAEERLAAARPPLEQAELRQQAAEAAYASGSDTFRNWVATRTATAQPGQDSELVTRTAALDALQTTVDTARKAAEAQRQVMLDAQQAANRANIAISPYEADATTRFETAQRSAELRVFLYRLALTLPLLVIAYRLFTRARQSRWWPFVWGFILFALFAFFVELVPYLPSYGGYVRFIVGIIGTVLVGRYAIIALGRYLEEQKRAEAQPDQVRREVLSYDAALVRLDKGACPGCERPVNLKDSAIDFCPHCGIGLFNHCTACDARKGSFAPFCHACGTAAAKAGTGQANAG